MTKSNPRPGPHSRAYEESIRAYIEEISRLQSALGEAESELARLRAEAHDNKGVRTGARRFYRAVDDAIIARIDRRGYTRNPSKRSVPPITPEVLMSEDRQEIMDAIRGYDRAAYFRRRASSSGMRLRYRVASKAYRIVRDTALFGLKKTLRVARKAAR